MATKTVKKTVAKKPVTKRAVTKTTKTVAKKPVAKPASSGGLRRAGSSAPRWRTRGARTARSTARWRSPVGPIQFDIAYGYPRKRIAPHISIGIMF